MIGGKKAVFLDRDGVLNQTIVRMGKPRAPYSLKELSLLEGVEEAVRRLKSAGFILIIVTNQPDVARGWVEKSVVESVNGEIMRRLELDFIKICYHTEQDECSCRKPRPGMLIQARDELGIDMFHSYMVGDRISDVEAGKSAGCSTILVGDSDRGNTKVVPDFYASTLLRGAEWILSR